MTTPAPVCDTALRACLIRLIHERASDEDSLKAFKGQAYMTLQRGTRLNTYPLSGGFDPAYGFTGTVPHVLSNIASALATPHGHVLCHTLLREDSGFTGVAVIALAAYWPSQSRKLFNPHKALIGVLVQLDDRHKVIHYSLETRVIDEDPRLADELQDVIEATWAVASTLDNMSRVPLSDEALRYAQELIDTEVSLSMGGGRRAMVNPIEPIVADGFKRKFLDRVAAAAAASGTPVVPAPTTPGAMVSGDPKEIVENLTRSRPDPTVAPTKYRLL